MSLKQCVCFSLYLTTPFCFKFYKSARWQHQHSHESHEHWRHLTLKGKLKMEMLCWYCWWLKSGDHQLRLVVYPVIYSLFYIPGGWPWDFWTINSITGASHSLNLTAKSPREKQAGPQKETQLVFQRNPFSTQPWSLTLVEHINILCCLTPNVGLKTERQRFYHVCKLIFENIQKNIRKNIYIYNVFV